MKKSSKVILVIIIIFVIALIGVGAWYVIDTNNKLKNEVNELKSQQNNLIESNDENNIGNSNVVNNSVTSNNVNQEKYEEIVAKYDNEDDDWIYNGENTKLAFSSAFNGIYGEKGLSITDIIKNSDNTYTIKGVVYENYKLTGSEIEELDSKGYIFIYGEKYKKDVSDVNEGVIGLVKFDGSSDYREYYFDTNKKLLMESTQWGECYRITNKHMQITVDADVLILGGSESAMQEGEGSTIAELYESKNGYVGYDDESGNKSDVKLYNFVFKNGECFEMFSIPYES